MTEVRALKEWMGRLRACFGATAVAQCLARAVAGMSGTRACAVGVFLLDQGGGALLLEGRHPCGADALAEPAAVPAWELDDPLAFSVHGGKPCRVGSELYAGLPASLEALCPDLAGDIRSAAVEPLVAPGDVVMGGVVLASRGRPAVVSEHVRIVLDYAAAILDGAVFKSRHRPLVDGLSQDCVRFEREARDARERPENIIVGTSESIEAIRSMVVNISASDVPVLITGETGTGKEVVATAIHNASSRRHGPFVQINCAALPSNLLESELFGHRKGAFSGAEAEHQGLLRSANGGTVLLDEIGDMPPEMQAKLLRTLQEHTVRPVGDVRSHAVNIRILAATNMDMRAAVEEGMFRRDLYHRLALVHLKLPPLRERLEDLPVLARHHLAHLAVRYRRPGLRIAPEAWAALSSLPYMGNVREFFSMLERAVILTGKESAALSSRDLLEGESERKYGALKLNDLVRTYESSVILEVMKFYDNRTREAASALGVPIRTLNHKLSRIGGTQVSMAGLSDDSHCRSRRGTHV
ncbi:sigma-54 interaction domain-containing protein [Desulfomicrobium escambiense]|uniref:sigma-54 interaction domain-containing protein n=1 Tax=Desulfomicrobium escambiense TaxID=29503 RepID=UPI0004241ABB|nr:sigma 54-interacting transcriptional regulator [Desulfomicrobium escambiense]